MAKDNAPPDEEAQRRMRDLMGSGSAQAHYAAVSARTTELIDRAFDLFRIVPGAGATVTGSDSPLISRQP